MTLETYEAPDDLYLARGEDVNPLRPLFTGDVVADLAIPGVQDGGLAAIVAHPCSMRGKDARLEPRVLAAAVAGSGKIGRTAWVTGNFGLMPLPDLLEAGQLWVARLDDIGKALTADIMAGVRFACLSPFGVNLLQQRFIFRFTRHEVPTYVLDLPIDNCCAKLHSKSRLPHHGKRGRSCPPRSCPPGTSGAP